MVRRLPMLALLVAVALAARPARAEAPILAAARALQCGEERDIRGALARLRAAGTGARGLPDEALSPTGAGRLGVAALDVLLRALVLAWDRTPALRRDIEAVVLQWSYCRLSTLAPGPSPVAGEGLRAWGLQPAKSRHVPELLYAPGLGPGQKELFWHDVAQNRCFPLPPGRVVGIPSDLPPPSPPPVGGLPAFAWERGCPSPETPETRRLALVAASIAGAAARPLPPGPPPPEVMFHPWPPRIEIAQPPLTPSAQPSSASGSPPAPVVHNGPRKWLVLAGNAYLSQRLSDPEPLVGVRAALYPIPFLFLRAGVELKPNAAKDPFTYTWGLGYDDWHPGTFSAQINHWTPISFDTAFDIRGAELDVGYKLPFPDKVAAKLGAVVRVNLRFTGIPSIAFNATWKPFGDWFIMAGVKVSPLEADVLTWFYGFGLFNWRPWSFSLAYYNWGPNPITTTGFIKNGTVALSWAWTL